MSKGEKVDNYCKMDLDGNVVWEVESILNEKVMKQKLHYRVKWRGYSDTTWEPHDNLDHLVHIIKEYRKKRKEEEQKKEQASKLKRKKKSQANRVAMTAVKSTTKLIPHELEENLPVKEQKSHYKRWRLSESAKRRGRKKKELQDSIGELSEKLTAQKSDGISFGDADARGPRGIKSGLNDNWYCSKAGDNLLLPRRRAVKGLPPEEDSVAVVEQLSGQISKEQDLRKETEGELEKKDNFSEEDKNFTPEIPADSKKTHATTVNEIRIEIEKDTQELPQSQHGEGYDTPQFPFIDSNSSISKSQSIGRTEEANFDEISFVSEISSSQRDSDSDWGDFEDIIDSPIKSMLSQSADELKVQSVQDELSNSQIDLNNKNSDHIDPSGNKISDTGNTNKRLFEKMNSQDLPLSENLVGESPNNAVIPTHGSKEINGNPEDLNQGEEAEPCQVSPSSSTRSFLESMLEIIDSGENTKGKIDKEKNEKVIVGLSDSYTSTSNNLPNLASQIKKTMSRGNSPSSISLKNTTETLQLRQTDEKIQKNGNISKAGEKSGKAPDYGPSINTKIKITHQFKLETKYGEKIGHFTKRPNFELSDKEVLQEISKKGRIGRDLPKHITLINLNQGTECNRNKLFFKVYWQPNEDLIQRSPSLVPYHILLTFHPDMLANCLVEQKNKLS